MFSVQHRPFDEAFSRSRLCYHAPRNLAAHMFSRSHAEICEALATVTSFEDDVPADAEMRAGGLIVCMVE